MSYTPTTWVNGSTPALNATNLNKMETGIDQAHAMLGEGVGLSGSLLFNNNIALQSKDTGGTARSILSMGTDNLTRVGPQVAPNSGGDLLFYANGAERGRFESDGDLKLNGKLGIFVSPFANLEMQYTSNTVPGIYAKNNYLTGAGNQTYATYMFDTQFSATDMAGSAGNIFHNGLFRTTVGDVSNAATGNTHTLSLEQLIVNSGAQSNEHAICYAAMVYNSTTSTPGTTWFTDWNLHTAINQQHQSIQGISLFINNHFNGSPVGNTFCGMALTTKQGSGGGGNAEHTAAATYPIDVGFTVCGHAGPSGSRQGWTTAFRAGGNAVWHDSGASRIGTGFHARDYETYGVLIDNRYSGSTAPAIAVASGQGTILSGGTTAMWAASRLEVQGPSGAADGLIVMGRDSVTNDYSMVLQTAAAFGRLFIAGGTNSFLTGTVEADIGLSHAGSGKRIHIGGNASVVSVGNDNTLAYRPSTSQTLVAGTAILANAGVVQITAASPITSTAAPTIASGVDGQRVIVINVGSNNITLSDQGTLASSNLRLSATTQVLQPRDSLELMFFSAIGDWVQISFTNVL